MSALPQVSCVIPAFNAADLIPRAIESVLSQEGAEIELVVVDDASTDGTSEAAAAMKAISGDMPLYPSAASSASASWPSRPK